MINKDNIRTFYKPDAATSDGILYFYPQKVDGGESLMWVCEKDPEIKYFFDIPFLDDNWEIQQRTNIKNQNGEYIWEGDVVHIRYATDDLGDWDGDDNFLFYFDEYCDLCMHNILDENDKYDILWIEFTPGKISIEEILKPTNK